MSGPDGLPPLREVIAAHGLAAKKSLGQNFLLDLNLTRKIARDENAPESLRARARQIAGLAGTDAIDDVEAVMDQIERNSARSAAGR